MKTSTRLLIVLVAVEALLFAIGAWLIVGLSNGSLHATNSPAESAQTVFSVMGTVMGAFAGVVGTAWFSMRRRGL